MSILKLPIQFNGLKGVYLGNSIVSFEKLLRDEYQQGNVVFELDNKLEEITINDSSLLIICRNSNVGNVSDVC